MEHVNAEILRAIADGKKVQYRHTWPDNGGTHYGLWKDFDGKQLEACLDLLKGVITIKWRIAPETITIGEHEVPAPEREAPEVGKKFWTLTPFGGATHFTWDGTKACYDALSSGFVHLTEKAAQQHYEAIKNLLAK